MHMLAVLMAE